MKAFAFARPASFAEAGELLADRRYSLPVLKAGGMDVVDHMKEGLLEPDLLIDIRATGVRPAGISRTDDGGLRIGAMTTLAEIAASPIVRATAPVVADAAGSAATPQVRNVATAAGNLLQRPRCWYYRNEQFHCLKKGGHTCYAVEGENKFHAIFGGGPCHIVHPSNLAPALAVCGGRVHLTGGDRPSLSIDDLYHAPAQGVWSEHELEKNEIITHITIGPASRSGFYAVKEKQSFDWPLVMASVMLRTQGSSITAARVSAGAVAPIPWRLPAVEAALAGVRVDDDAGLRKACAGAADGANPLSDNAYKASLLPVAVRRAVLRATGRDEKEA
ncbi:MAG: xanthine dehydrogenase family protein subunit M [Phycisphaerales bacterium]|nr:FAD binding domain-containing protein [Phycisphaerae bacterium]NNF44602.1 xanthine dehydrogenase family protein subunit M [Phycisphaerales bacterium]NNM24687.1 xanthine dehydrogenase family protein subunit M [Phycisphaerales bacterium]